jgi:hypothetical protein
MAQKSNDIRDREFSKFVESQTRPGESAVEVVGSFTTSAGPFDPPVNSDTITREVSGSVETYRYRQGGVTGTIIKSIVVTYASSALEELISVRVL